MLSHVFPLGISYRSYANITHPMIFHIMDEVLLTSSCVFIMHPNKQNGNRVNLVFRPVYGAGRHMGESLHCWPGIMC